MPRRERPRPGPAARVEALLEAGDHRAAAAAARATLSGAAAGEAERAAAAAALASLRPEPAAVWAGAAGVIVSIAVLLRVVLGSGR